MEAQAKAAAGSGAQVGVADVYRDGDGGIWWDADEELEYTHLLADSDARSLASGGGGSGYLCLAMVDEEVFVGGKCFLDFVGFDLGAEVATE
jgi:hypothetical protein